MAFGESIANDYDAAGRAYRGRVMPKGFTGIRLLLVFVAINTILALVLVTSMTSAHPWLANVLPGRFETGVNGSGYWVFFSMVLMINALAVVLAGAVMIFPLMLDSPPHPRRIESLLDRANVTGEAREASLKAAQAEAAAAGTQISIGRIILLVGAVFLTLGFTAVTTTVVHALPYSQMFENGDQLWRFTGDQLAGALVLDVPEIYDWHFGNLANYTDNSIFAGFVFAFRAILGWVGLMTVMTLVRGLRMGWRRKPAKVEK
jgi:hypothetical protein